MSKITPCSEILKMRSFILTTFFSIAVGCAFAQAPVFDTHPQANIYIIDPQTNQEVLGQGGDAILFKDAFIDLVNNTQRARFTKAAGHKTLTITQMDPAGGDAYQLTLESKIFGQTYTVYTFAYNVDQNTLYFYDQGSQSYIPEIIQQFNLVNLNNCSTYGQFNNLTPPPANNDQTADASQADQPVYADSTPPALQTDEQPECPVDGYLWQPGYWAFKPAGGYYWVNGAWVAPPQEGLLWTPPYWGFEGGRYFFHSGYWGNEVGYYGGVYYGYGYGGHGYYGGSWNGGHFRYNTAVVRVNVTVVHNTYVDRTVVTAAPQNHASFNGPGGATAKPTPHEMAVANQKHVSDFSQNPRAAKTNSNAQGHVNAPNNNANRQQGGNNTQRSPNATQTGVQNNNVQRGTNGNTPNTQATNTQRTPNSSAPTNGAPRVPVNTFSSRSTNGYQGGSGSTGRNMQNRNKTLQKAPAQKTDNNKKQ